MAKDRKAEGAPEARAGSGVSRRDFLRGGAAGALAAGLLPGALVAGEGAAGAAGAVVGPGAVEVKLNVNGRGHALELEPRVTLLDALRDHLELTGTKKVCDRATCGACTVLLDGKPAYSCTVLAIEAQGRKIETIEGMGTAEDLHPLQAAFVEHDAQQCGFCTPGMVMAARALLERDASPSAAALERGLGGNLCRCGTYAGIRGAVRAMAAGAKGGGRHG